MSTQEVLADLRKEHNLSQEQMAEKLYITRQAVSRWETGETIPNIETLKLISKEFDVSIDQLLGEQQERICQSCAMPMQEFDELGTEADGGATTEYCTHCYREGGFTHNRSIDEMIESNLKSLEEFNAQTGSNYTEDEARDILKLHLKTLKRWSN